MLINDSFGSESTIDQPICAQYETYTTVRFVFITLATVIACLGTFGNLLLIHIFAAKKATITPATLYPTILAFLDFAICLEYLLLFGVDAAVSFLRIESLFLLYYMYIIPAYVASRITQLAIPYMLIFATVERLVWTSKNIRSRFLLAMYSTSGRYFTAIISLLVCVALRLPTAFAIEVTVYPQCEDFFRTMTTQPREWTYDSHIYHFFDFHLMTITQTLVPFVLLLALNIVIIRKITASNQNKEIHCHDDCRGGGVGSGGGGGRDKSGGALKSTKTKSSTVHHFSIPRFPDRMNASSVFSIRLVKKVSSSVRSAILTMVAIVASYLISNTLHLILTVLERSDHPLLHDTEDPLLSSTFHTFFSDAVSFVYMFTSAIRILIYFGCNPVIRSHILNILHPNPAVSL